MSTSIPGRGKQRKHGQDLNTNSHSMGGGQMAMPPNGAAVAAPPSPFATPMVHQTSHVPDYAPRTATHAFGHSDYMSTQPVGNHPAIVVQPGMSVHQEPTSAMAYNAGGPPQNMQNMPRQAVNPNMQWQGVPQQPQPYGTMPQQGNMYRGGPPQQQQGRPAYQQQPQQMGYPANYGMQQAQPYYMGPANMAYGGYVDPQQQQQYQLNQYQQQQLAYQQQYQQMHQMQQGMPHQQQQGGPMQTMQAPPALQQQQQPQLQQGGAPPGTGVPPNQQAQSQQQQSQPQPNQMQHGGPQHGPGAPQQHQQGPVVGVPAGGPYNNPPVMQPQQQQQPRQPAPVVPKKKNILLIMDPNSKKVLNEAEIEAANKAEEEATKEDKDESKGSDETDSAAPEVKRQFAENILEQATKTEQPAPAPTPAVTAPKQRKVLFSLDQLGQLGLAEKVEAAAVSVVPEQPKAAAAAVEPTKASEYLPEPLPEPAYPNNYKEKQQQAKHDSPDVTQEVMPAATHHEEPQEAAVVPEEPASSSSEKNTSNDSAICVQTPPPAKEAAAKKAVAVVVEEEQEEKPVVVDEEPAVEEEEEQKEDEDEAPVAESGEINLAKKLEELVIAEQASQEDAESEPSTPAPVTPSVSETGAALAEEEEDAESAAAAAEELRQQERERLEAEIAKNEEDLDQVNIALSRYNREYLYNVRDLEKEFHVTPCPLTPEELKNFGICRSQVSSEPKRKQDGQGSFMPGWARSGGQGPRGGHDRQPYKGRQSEHAGPRGPPKQGSNRKLPPSIRPSIERRVETNVQLHKAEKAWKPEKVTEVDAADEEAKKKVLLKTIRSLFNKITPTTKDALINEFLDHKVYESPALNDVISIIFDKAVEEPKFCPLYSSMCQTQVSEELRINNNVSNFRNAILVRAQETFTTKNLDDLIKEKNEEIAAETDEKKKKEKQIELLETQSKFRRRKFGNITFIGQLYLQNLISVRIILFCVVDLLKSVTDRPANVEGYEADEESIDCAVRLLETIGKRLQEEANRAAKELKDAKDAAERAAKTKTITRNPPPKQNQQPSFPIDMTFQTLEGAIPFVSSRIKFMIMNLAELRKNGWIPRKGADAGPKKLDEIKKDIQKEQLENAHQQQQYERKQSRQEYGGGRGPMGGGGGGGGGHGGPNPKRQIIQRNSQDNRNDNRTVEEKRTQAHKSSTLLKSTAQAKKVSLSAVTGDAGGGLGGRPKNKWAGGASGGSETSKKEEAAGRAAAIQSASRFAGNQRSSSSASMKGAEEEAASGRSSPETQANSEDPEQKELREKQARHSESAILKKCMGEVGDYFIGECTLDDAREGILGNIMSDKDKYGKPSLTTVFKLYLAAAVKKIGSEKDTASKFGHVLAYCVAKKVEDKDNKGKEEIFKGIAEACREIVAQEQWEDVPKIWEIVAEVLISAHVPTEGLYEGYRPILTDFKDAFLAAAKDDRKDYELFVLVLKRLAEKHESDYTDVCGWVFAECESIVKHMKKEKLDEALRKTTAAFGKNLFELYRQVE